VSFGFVEPEFIGCDINNVLVDYKFTHSEPFDTDYFRREGYSNNIDTQTPACQLI
jgi:hypothetical protein